jgi:hypothetical protein
VEKGNSERIPLLHFLAVTERGINSLQTVGLDGYATVTGSQSDLKEADICG